MTPLLEDSANQASRLVFDAHVRAKEKRGASAGVDLVRHFPGLLFAAAEIERHLGPVLRQLQCDRAAEATRSAGHERRPAFQACHGSLR